MKLLLWDIDGTILASGGAGVRALEESLEKIIGSPPDLSDIDWAGRTDRWITEAIFAKYAVEHTPDLAAQLIDAYLAELPDHMTRSTRVLPGIRDRLAEADTRPDVVQGLLTGNLERGAKIKLGHFDLWHHFPFGAFADDSAVRNELGPHALARATQHTGHHFDPSDVWIIGDTQHDIACGKIIGARTLAVATGHHTPDQLAAHTPDALLTDLSDSNLFWATIAG
jgi:phosphoglycolate phosphatase